MHRNYEPSSYTLASWLFLRALALVYCIAFLSLAVQIRGLIGQDGILPASDFHQQLTANLGAARFHLAPTLTWLNTSDTFLSVLTWGGAALSLLAALGITQAPLFIVLWAFYLSLTIAGQRFLTFQWDTLLLEAGLLAIFLAPWKFRAKLARARAPAAPILWLYWFLVFRFFLASGLVKLMSGDTTWRTLTALSFHYETQPIPNPVAWYIHQLPLLFHRLSTLGALIIEIGAPLLIFSSPRLRRYAAAALAALLLFILTTGNFAFFNLLSFALLILLLDDSALYRALSFLPTGVRRWLHFPLPTTTDTNMAMPTVTYKPGRRISRLALSALAIFIASLGIIRLVSVILPDTAAARLNQLTTWAAPYYIANHYGLFSVMTTTRPEIFLEGSSDGTTWYAYEFRYKAGNPSRRPPQVAPHQPRLDWQMWFAGLTAEHSLAQGQPRFDGWFIQFIRRLLEGSPNVLALLEHNPFPDKPPSYIRATLYNYRFTDTAEHTIEGTWWTRERIGLYLPPLTLDKNLP